MDKITVHINRPDIDFTNERSIKRSIDELSRVVAVEVIAELAEQQQKRTLQYWHDKLMSWEIENKRIDLRARRLNNGNEGKR